MSNSINELDSYTVRFLSSSQVITSVYSVVKELLENAIDASATSIELKLDDYGLGSIDVKDNGRGIPTTQLQFVARGHHTSKITTFGDLESLDTYGFRGEALGSLCALCELSITTRTSSDEHAVTVTFNKAGGVITTKPSHLNKGTTISVRKLFHDFPVRKQFYATMKRKKDELRRIEDCLMSFSIIHPQVRLNLTNDKTVVYQKLPLPNSGAVLLSVLSSGPFSQLESVDAVVKTAIGEISIESFLPHAESKVALSSRAVNDRSFVYVNNRPVNMKAIDKLVKEYYCSCHNCDRWPVFFLSIVIPPATVDVNVVPNKTEVMFREQDEVMKAITNLLENHFNKIPANINLEEKSQKSSEEKINSGKNPKNNSDLMKSGDMLCCNEKINQIHENRNDSSGNYSNSIQFDENKEIPTNSEMNDYYFGKRELQLNGDENTSIDNSNISDANKMNSSKKIRNIVTKTRSDNSSNIDTLNHSPDAIEISDNSLSFIENSELVNQIMSPVFENRQSTGRNSPRMIVKNGARHMVPNGENSLHPKVGSEHQNRNSNSLDGSFRTDSLENAISFQNNCSETCHENDKVEFLGKLTENDNRIDKSSNSVENDKTTENPICIDSSFEDLFTSFYDDSLVNEINEKPHETTALTNENASHTNPDQSDASMWSRGLSARDESGNIVEPVTMLTADSHKRPRSPDIPATSQQTPPNKRVSLEQAPHLKHVSNVKKSAKIPRSPFVHFSLEFRPQVIQDQPGIELIELDRIVKEGWEALSVDARDVYEKRSQHDIARYRRPSTSMKTNTKNMSLPEAMRMMMTQKRISSQSHLKRKSETIQLCVENIKREYITGGFDVSQDCNDSFNIIGQIDDCWVFSQGGVVSLVHPRRLQECLVYTRLLSHHKLSGDRLDHPIILDNQNLPSKCMKTLLSLAEASHSNSYSTASDERVTANGFTIKFWTGEDSNPHFMLTHISQSIPGYSVLDLQHVLEMITDQTSLAECRPPKVIDFFKSETLRMVPENPAKKFDKSDIESLLHQMTGDLAPQTCLCFHNTPFIQELYDLEQLKNTSLSQTHSESAILCE